MICKTILFSCFFNLGLFCGHQDDGTPPTYIEFKADGAGLFSNLARVGEWIYCIKQNPHIGLMFSFSEHLGINRNLFGDLFKKVDDPQLEFDPNHSQMLLSTHWFPCQEKNLEKITKTRFDFSAKGMKNFPSHYVYMNYRLYDDPDFAFFRSRMHEVIQKYLQPAPDLQKRIDTVLSQLNQPNHIGKEDSVLKIGISIRCTQLYQGLHIGCKKFLKMISRDINQIMSAYDPDRTRIFLATQLDPVVQLFSTKKNVIYCDIPRLPRVNIDWSSVNYKDPLDRAYDALVDIYCLANCDIVYCGSSNMAIYAGCINPNLKIRLLPSLATYSGS